jgi:hypothetical protein
MSRRTKKGETVPAAAGVVGAACLNTFTLTAAVATAMPVNNGIFNVPPWIKSSNDRK